MQMAAGIHKFKCATIAEAEMVASCGAPDILIAYQLVGPNQTRLLRLMQKFPNCQFGVLFDHPEAARSLVELATAAHLTINGWLDIDVGQHRTGIPIGEEALALYKLLAELPGARPVGLHVYDGHNHQENPADREAAVKAQFEPVASFIGELQRRGLAVLR